MYVVYSLRCPKTNIVKYIGKGTESRAFNYSNRSAKCKNWIKSIYPNQPITQILERFENEIDALRSESDTILLYREAGFPLLNMTSGGEGTSGYKWTKEQREKLSRSCKGRQFNALAKERSSAANSVRNKLKKGIPLSEEHRNKLIGSHNRKGKEHIYSKNSTKYKVFILDMNNGTIFEEENASIFARKIEVSISTIYVHIKRKSNILKGRYRIRLTKEELSYE